MATWPSSTKASTANCDSGSDSPRLFRADAKQNIDNQNAIIDMFNISSPSNNQILKYNSSNARFELAADSAAGGITFVGDDSSGTLVNIDETFKVAGAGTVTTAVSGDVLTITGATPAVTALNNATANEIVTVGSTTTELDAESGLTFDGSTLAVTGAITATTNVTATGSISNDAVSITDNVIQSSRSNDDLMISANGTGRVQLVGGGGNFAENYNSNSRYSDGNIIYKEDLSLTIGDGNRHYKNAMISYYKLASGQSSSNSNDRFRQAIYTSIDLNGSSSTSTSATFRSRGPMGADINTTVENNGSGASTLGTVSANMSGVLVYGNNQNITITDATGVASYLENSEDGSGTVAVDNFIGFYSMGDIGTDATVTGNMYHFYANNNSQNPAGSTYSFYQEDLTDLLRIGKLEAYSEKINSLTSSSTITVDTTLAPFHTVTLATNTQFVISGLIAGQTVTIKIKQDGTGSRTASFGTGDSTAVKFAGGAPTLSTGANAIDVVTVFYDGTDYIGNIAKAFA